ncbi:MAG: helix-turn-helix domain-containing protein, partial [Mucilaginibacter polytrichastri]|nr:helix-turn-helix domain-containing protein [Mucilaginibacter polytrichastri]
QGLTFDKAIIDVGKAFAPGQVYVALSRLRSLEGLVLTSLIGTRGIAQDQHVFEFGRSGKTRENPSVQIKTDTAEFLREYLFAAFDFGQSAWQLTEHRQSYTKDENRSAKQTHESWAAAVLDEFVTLKNHADGFRRQLNKLFLAEAPMSQVQERVEAATQFFIPKLDALSETVLAHVAAVKIQKHVKTYLTELLELELVFFEQQKRVRKAGALLLAISGGTSFTKENVAQLIDLQAREEKLKAALASPVQALSDEKSAVKEAKPKKSTGDSRKISLQLFKEGKSVSQIAANRNMTVGTIEGHLAYFVARNELAAAEIIPQKKLDEILAAIKKLETVQMNPIKEYLGKNYSFNEIRVGLAHHLAAKE